MNNRSLEHAHAPRQRHRGSPDFSLPTTRVRIPAILRGHLGLSKVRWRDSEQYSCPCWGKPLDKGKDVNDRLFIHDGDQFKRLMEHFTTLLNSITSDEVHLHVDEIGSHRNRRIRTAPRSRKEIISAISTQKE